MSEFILAAEVGLLVANLAVLALTIKLYTEWVKDRNQERRKQP
jgi:hypothetical protein